MKQLYEHNKLKEPKELKELFSTAVFYFSILFFIVAFNFSDVTLTGNWTQQFMPFLNNKPINDIIFIDSLTGFAIASKNINPDTSCILKTINGGDNWQIITTLPQRRFSRIQFINSLTGFICGGTGSGTPYFYKSTNGGDNWQVVTTYGCAQWSDMSVLNVDTIWLADGSGACGGIYMTPNGGVNWIHQYGTSGGNPNKIYMYNSRIGFMTEGFYLYKTTDSGFNWTQIIGENGFTDIYFADSLTGWKANDSMKMTTNGGLNWLKQNLPVGGNISIFSRMRRFSNVNKDTIWGTGGSLQVGFNDYRGIIYRTNNNGNNWLFQVPDTSFGITGYYDIQFLNKNTGWAFGSRPVSDFRNIHTTNGGDTTFYMGIQQTNNNIPKDFILKQNYPNPFNPRTVIPYSIKSSALVKLIAYDILGKEVQVMVDNFQQAGEYEVDFMGKFSSSGIYFYKITINTGKEIYTDTKKMILIK